MWPGLATGQAGRVGGCPAAGAVLASTALAGAVLASTVPAAAVLPAAISAQAAPAAASSLLVNLR